MRVPTRGSQRANIKPGENVHSRSSLVISLSCRRAACSLRRRQRFFELFRFVDNLRQHQIRNLLRRNLGIDELIYAPSC